MPAEQRGWVRKRNGGWQACWRERGRQRTAPHLFASKTDAKRWLDDNLTRGRLHTPPVQVPEPTFAEHLDRYLRTHAATVQPATIRTLRERLGAFPEERPGRKRASRSYKTAADRFGDGACLSRADERGDRRVASNAAGRLPVRNCALAPAGSGGGRPLEPHSLKPSQAGRPKPTTAPRGSRLLRSRSQTWTASRWSSATPAKSNTAAPCSTAPSRSSVSRPACGRPSGSRSNAATSTAKRSSCTYADRSSTAPSKSTARLHVADATSL